MFKKIISALVASTIVMTLSVPAFAIDASAAFGVAAEHPEKQTSQKEEFTFCGKKINDYVNYVPAGEKITITAKKDGIMVSKVHDIAGEEMSETLYKDDSFGPVGFDGMKKDSKLYFTVKESSEIQVFQIKSPIDNQFWPIYFKTGTASNAAKAPVKEEQPAKDTTKAPVKDPVKAPVEPSTPTRSGLDIIHTVKMGDTFGGLALNYFGDMTCWPAIYNYNANAINATKDKQIFEGMELIIPSAVKHGEKNISAIAPCVLGNGEKLYTVQSGDTLGTIALAQYKDMSKYKAIFERNADRLASANTIYAGQIIVMPVQ